jgi:purine-binding chemotaxis protein CheW
MITTDQELTLGSGNRNGVIQLSTFYVADRCYGLRVTQVQEIVKPMPMTTVPLAAHYIRGLINLRGQVATAIGIRELFELPEKRDEDSFNVICKVGQNLLALQVDDIGDVVERPIADFESVPSTLSSTTQQFLEGIFQTEDGLLSIVNLDQIMDFLIKANQAAA